MNGGWGNAYELVHWGGFGEYWDGIWGNGWMVRRVDERAEEDEVWWLVLRGRGLDFFGGCWEVFIVHLQLGHVGKWVLMDISVGARGCGA